MTLYEIADQYNELLGLAENEDIPADALQDTFEAINGEFEIKVDSIASAIKNLIADADAIKAEEDSLESRRKSKERTVERLKFMLTEALESTGKAKVETARNCVSFRKSTSVRILDEEDFKQRYRNLCNVEESVKIPKSTITKMLKDGKEFEGAYLETKNNLQIK